jgi:phosphatidylglycerol---prolipoprotein diacylglyceryl transferase
MLDSLGIHIAGFILGWYPLVVIAGIGGGTLVAAQLALLRGQDSELVWRGLVWVIPLAACGGRLWFVLFPSDSAIQNGFTAAWMLTHFFDLNAGAVAIWAGGLGLIGAIAGGTAGLVLFTRANHLPLLAFLDIAAVGLPFAQAFARLGNGISQNLYGPPTELPWAMLISDPAQRVPPYTNLSLYPLETTKFQPVYFYEMVVAALIFIVLWRLFILYEIQPGRIALLYVALYGAGRFLLEFMRVDVSRVGPVNISQAVAGVAALIAALVLTIQHYRYRQIHLVGDEAQSDSRSG